MGRKIEMLPESMESLGLHEIADIAGLKGKVIVAAKSVEVLGVEQPLLVLKDGSGRMAIASDSRLDGDVEIFIVDKEEDEGCGTENGG